MALIYETEQIYTGPRGPIKTNPVKSFMTHYGNYKYLKFIHDSTKSGVEKRQANQEIQIAQKKMDRFYKMIPRADHAELEKQKKVVDHIWDAKS